MTVQSGQDTTVLGSQLTGDKVVANIGHNLTIESLQDSDNYDYEALSHSVGASFKPALAKPM